jgi:dTDP-4-dehydrorhamnose 3,5-epimerase
MKITQLEVPGAWLHTPTRHEDNRGHFEEQFKASDFEGWIPRDFKVMQVNKSMSAKGVIRGIHVTDGPKSQQKYVTCPKGAIWDVVVDLRPESPKFGSWSGEILSEANGCGVFIPAGVGHCFLSLMDGSVTNYLCSEEYDPTFEVTISPFSPRLGIDFASLALVWGFSDFILSEKDLNAKVFIA